MREWRFRLNDKSIRLTMNRPIDRASRSESANREIILSNVTRFMSYVDDN